MNVQRFLRRPDKSLRMSVPPVQELYGVKIRKLPMGKYLQVLRAMEDLPAVVLGELFPGCDSMPKMLSMLEHIDRGGMTKLAVRLLAVLPEQFCRMVSSLLDIPSERLLNPDASDALGLAELAEILEAAWKANDLSGFFGTVRRLLTPAGQTPNSGSNAGSQSRKVWASPGRS